MKKTDKTNNGNQIERKKNGSSANKKILLLFMVGALCIILLFGSKTVTAYQQKVSYNDFIVSLNAGQVKTADIDANSGKVTYTLSDSDKEFYTNYPYTDEFMETLLVNNVDVEIHEGNWFITFAKYCATPLILIMLMGIMYATQFGGDADFEDATNKPTTKFDDVAGLDEIKEDLSVLSSMMKEDKYKMSGARIPRGILLQGPPGNGKTLLARAFAGETGVNFIAVNACDLGSPFVGVGSMKIKKVFNAAKKKAPCVIFIDELDAVGSKRGEQQDSGSKEMNSILTSLLNQMDGFTPMDNVMVLAATNKVENLDEALIRPGRFDRQFVIGYPDKVTRKALLELYLKKTNRKTAINIDEAATKSYGYSCSKIECAVNEAIINSIKRNANNDTDDMTIIAEDFDDAIFQMDIKGHLKKNKERNEIDNTIVAYHEAGHAVLGHFVCNKMISTISIAPTTSGAGGFTVTEEIEDRSLCSMSDYKDRIIMLYGGRASEYVLGNSMDAVSGGAIQDIKEATRIAANYIELKDGVDYTYFNEFGVKRIMTSSEDVLNDCWFNAVKYIEQYWSCVDAVAKKLIEKETLSSVEFKRIISNFH